MKFGQPTEFSPEEKGKEVKDELARSGIFNSTKKRLEEFLALPDDPGLPYEEQLKLREKSELTQSEEDIENYKKNKESKYRSNALATPLIMIQAFLTRAPEAKNMPEEMKVGLLDRVKNAREHILKELPAAKISKESVDEVIDIVKATQAFLN